MVKEVKLDKMDELIRALEGEGGLPIPTSADNGKVLGVVEGDYALKDEAGVDMTGAQAGQVLTAIEDMGGNLKQGWTTPSGGLPSIGSADDGKLLQAYYDSRTETSGTQWISAPIIKSETYTSEDITVDDKSGEAHMSIPSGSVFINMCFKGNSDAIYPVEIENYGTSGIVYISSTEYQRIVDEPDGHFTIYYI